MLPCRRRWAHSTSFTTRWHTHMCVRTSHSMRTNSDERRRISNSTSAPKLQSDGHTRRTGPAAVLRMSAMFILIHNCVNACKNNTHGSASSNSNGVHRSIRGPRTLLLLTTTATNAGQLPPAQPKRMMFNYPQLSALPSVPVARRGLHTHTHVKVYLCGGS